MPDQPNKHGPRLDDEMVHEVDALVHGAPDDGRTEARRQQAPGDDDDVFRQRADVADAAPAGLTDAELEERSRLAASLSPSVFPATRDELVASAREQNAPGPLIESLRRLPEHLRFDTVTDVWEALGGASEAR